MLNRVGEIARINNSYCLKLANFRYRRQPLRLAEKGKIAQSGALWRAKPAFGVTDVPIELGAFREFDAAILNAMQVLDCRLRSVAKALPLNAVYGAWEGGLPAAEARLQKNSGALEMRLACFNVQGACGHDGGLGLKVMFDF